MMKRRTILLLLAFALFLCLSPNPAWASAPATEAPVELRTIVPDGVTEIDLQTVLGDDVLEVMDVWLLNADVGVILRYLQVDDKMILCVVVMKLSFGMYRIVQSFLGRLFYTHIIHIRRNGRAPVSALCLIRKTYVGMTPTSPISRYQVLPVNPEHKHGIEHYNAQYL